ncbi:MAG TPA: acyl-CoA reductase [Longimicrobiales bacterium]
MSAFDAFHLPGFDAAGASWATLEAEGRTFRYPMLSAVQMRELAARLRANRARHLARRPVAEVIDVIDQAGRMFARGGAMRAETVELLPAVTRMSVPMIELILDRMSADWQGAALRRLVALELGSPNVLDRFVSQPDAGRSVRALGPELALTVFAGNVPGVPVTALVRCLLVKAAVIGKSAADDPVLAVLFARALERVDPALASCIALTYWPGGAAAPEEAALAEADTVVVYGGADAIASIRRRAPARTRVLEHGPRMSLGFVAREALVQTGARALARSVAVAAATFDQHGCVSLHGAVVERGGDVDPKTFAEIVFEELEAIGRDLPAGRLTAGEAAALQAERGRAEFAHLAGGAIWASGRAGATVVYSEAPDLTPSCLDRFIRVGAVDRIEDVLPALDPLRGLLQTAGLAAEPPRNAVLADFLAEAGFTRIAPFDAMPWPPAHWHHDGAAPLAELVRWVDLES